jgi:hypothetical protein
MMDDEMKKAGIQRIEVKRVKRVGTVTMRKEQSLVATQLFLDFQLF